MIVEVTPIGVIFAVMLGFTLVFDPKKLVWLLSIAVPFSHTAMVVVGDNGISPFWTVAVVAVGRLAYILVHRVNTASTRRTRRVAGFRLVGANLALIIFAAYGALITLVGPALFAGTPVITPRGGLDSQIGDFTPLQYTSSNFAQLSYLIVGVALIVYLVYERPKSPRVIEGAIVAGIAVTLYKHFFLTYWPQSWFDSNPSYYYHWIFAGARERGPFAEPSLLGMFIGMSIAYLVSAAIFSGWVRRIYYGVLVAASLYIYAVSYTGTALLSLGTVVALAFVYVAVRVFLGQGRRGRLMFVAVIAAVAVLVGATWNYTQKYTVGLVLQKLGSDSFRTRNASNANSWNVMLDSFGLGVGFGSDRPSSLFFLLLASVGVIGVVLFFRATLGYMTVSMGDISSQPVVWAFVAQFVGMLVAKPDISAPAFWLLAGLLAAVYNQFSYAYAPVVGEKMRIRDRLASLVRMVPMEIESLRLRTVSGASGRATGGGPFEN